MPPDQAPAASTTISAGRGLAGDHHAGGPATIGDHGLDRRMVVQPAAGPAQRLHQGRHQPAVVDLVVGRAVHGGGEARAQHRFALQQLGAGQPAQIDAELALVVAEKRSSAASSRVRATASVPSLR